MPSLSYQHSILLTHPSANVDVLSHGLSKLKLNVLHEPMIHTESLALCTRSYELIKNADNCIFTSKNAIKHFFQQVQPELIQTKNIFCVGKKTAESLLHYGIVPTRVSQGKTAADMVQDLSQQDHPKHEKWVCILGTAAENTLVDGLKKYYPINRINIYQTITKEEKQETTIRLLKSKKDLWVSCTSPSCFTTFLNLYGELLHENIHFVSIGPVTTEAMKKKHITPELEAQWPTYENLLQDLSHYFTKIQK